MIEQEKKENQHLQPLLGLFPGLKTQTSNSILERISKAELSKRSDHESNIFSARFFRHSRTEIGQREIAGVFAQFYHRDLMVSFTLYDVYLSDPSSGIRYAIISYEYRPNRTGEFLQKNLNVKLIGLSKDVKLIRLSEYTYLELEGTVALIKLIELPESTYIKALNPYSSESYKFPKGPPREFLPEPLSVTLSTLSNVPLDYSVFQNPNEKDVLSICRVHINPVSNEPIPIRTFSVPKDINPSQEVLEKIRKIRGF